MDSIWRIPTRSDSLEQASAEVQRQKQNPLAESCGERVFYCSKLSLISRKVEPDRWGEISTVPGCLPIPLTVAAPAEAMDR